MNSKITDTFSTFLICVLLIEVKISHGDIDNYYGEESDSASEESDSARYKTYSYLKLCLQIYVYLLKFLQMISFKH